MVKLDKRVESCNTVNDLSNKVCVPNKRKDFKSNHVQHDYRNKCTKNINKTCINMYHANVNVNLIVENAIQIKSGVIVNVNASSKNIIYLESCYMWLQKW